MRAEGPPGGTAAFRREWNFAFGLVAAGACLLLAFGYSAAGAIAFALCAAAYAARRRAMRREGRRFYGEETRPH